MYFCDERGKYEECASCIHPKKYGCERVQKEKAEERQTAQVLGSNSTPLLNARDKAINAMTDLAEVFRSMGVYHYEEMVRGQQQAIRGAVITVENALSSGI